MKKDYRVIIPPIAKESLREIVEYIKIESPSAAIKVKKKINRNSKGSKKFTGEVFKRVFLV